MKRSILFASLIFLWGAAPALPDKCVATPPLFKFDKDRNQVRHGYEWECWETGLWKIAGQWSYGKKKGWWLKWHENGKKKWEGEYIDGKLHGYWAFWR